MTTVDQEHCIAAIAAGDREALAALYRETSKDVYGFALSILKNTHDAEDVLHDCFIAVFRAAEDYRPQGKPLAWILTITRNLCMQRLRERGRAAELPQQEQAFFDADPEDRAVLEACLQHLKEEERQILMLHAVSGFRHREIAALLDLPLATVLSKYHRAKKKLKSQLEGEWNA